MKMLKTLRTIKQLKGKRVLLRVDFNVPHGDDTRIRETLPTLRFLIRKGARTIVMTHLGRPDGKVKKELRVDDVGKRLSRLLKKKVQKLDECIGEKVSAAVTKMKNGELILLENIRFYEGEEKNETSFVKALAMLGDIFVNDAFAVSHRAHASTVGVAKKIPGYAGLLLEREIHFLSPLVKRPPSGLTLIVGGAKVDTKIGLLKNFFGKADYILIGGALANTFLAAQGYNVGASLYEKEKIDVAQQLLMLAENKKQKLLLPKDVIVADTVGENATTLDLPIEDIEGDMKILDIGSRTQKRYGDIIRRSKTVVWNGPMGLYEYTPFSSGTKSIAKVMAAAGPKVKTYIGGGDTIDALKRCKISQKKLTFVSTGGGAMLEFLEGKSLPGIEVLTASGRRS